MEAMAHFVRWITRSSRSIFMGLPSNLKATRGMIWPYRFVPLPGHLWAAQATPLPSVIVKRWKKDRWQETWTHVRYVPAQPVHRRRFKRFFFRIWGRQRDIGFVSICIFCFVFNHPIFVVWYRTQKLIGWKPNKKNLSVGPLNICWTRTMWQKDATQMQGAGTLTAFPLCWMKKGTFIILLWQHFWSHINAMDLLKWSTCQYVNLI